MSILDRQQMHFDSESNKNKKKDCSSPSNYMTNVLKDCVLQANHFSKVYLTTLDEPFSRFF